MSGWEIVEELPHFGGDAVYYPKAIVLRKYYPGPDRRYKGELLKIEGPAIRAYRLDLEKSWSRFEEMRSEFKDGTNISSVAFGYSTILVNYMGRSGITEYNYNGFIGSRERLDNICAELKSMTLRHLQVLKRMGGVR